MAVFSFTAAGSLGMSTTSYGAMQTKVARIVGAQDNPSKVGAGDAIRDALTRMNEYTWEYLNVSGDDITVVAGTSRYDLPVPFKKPVSLRFTTNERELKYVRRADYNSTYRNQSGLPAHYYTLFNHRQTAEVELLGPPQSADTMEIRYTRPVLLPNANSELLDMLEWHGRFVKLDAQVQVAMERGLDLGLIDRLKVDREDALRGIIADDRDPGVAADEGLKPFAVHGDRGFPEDHPYHAIMDGE